MNAPRVAGVMGWPIGHSRSPVLFAHWFERLGITGGYVPLAVAPDNFAEVYRALPKAGFCGVNVTLPHKEAALALADDSSPAARAIGAANMIRFEDGRILADNTDGIGFMENLRQEVPSWDPAAGPALVLGAGGAARAILYALAEAGVTEIRLTNRTAARAEALASAIRGPIRVVAWNDRAAAGAEIATLVNTTSLGMTGQPALDFPLEGLPQSALVTDLVYSPLETPLLAAARARGLVAVDGLGMLLHQARPAFKAWFGVDPPVDERLRTAVLGQ